MTGLVKAPLQTVVVEGIYNDILTKNAQYYYFLGRTNPWTVADGASPGEDGVWLPGSMPPLLQAPEPSSTFRYELGVRNNIVTYKLLKPSDVAYVIPRYNWQSGITYDMYDDIYNASYTANSGASSLETARFYVLTSLNNVYKCISNNYDAKSTVEPSGTAPTEYTTSDGYIWKFMYTIPVALQNKFYTFDYIPVMTSLLDRFYENGAITSVSVQNPGTTYTNNVTLSISGDGFLENNPYAIGATCVVINGGGGYKPTVAATGVTWLANVVTVTSAAHGFNAGDNITIRNILPTNYNGNYTIVATTTNTFTYALVSNPGTYTSGGAISLDILTFSAPMWGAFKTPITGYVTISSLGVITAINCDTKIVNTETVYGYGYDQNASMSIAGPFSAFVLWAGNTTYALNQIIEANGNYYKVTTAGQVNTTVPIHLTGTITFGTCALLYVGSDPISQVIVSKTEAIMTPIIQGGSIVGVQVVNGGVGYTYCNIIPQDSPVNNTAVLTVNIAIGNIDTVQADVELTAMSNKGALSYIKLAQDPVTKNYLTTGGYNAATTSVQITGDGTGATAVPIIVDGTITGIRLTNHGTGYTREATVTIYPQNFDTNGVYIGTQARAILSPAGGHGSNAIHEFNSSKILFYSVLSDERLFGLPNLNDYRQFGVVKNPKSYATGSRVSSTSATPSWLITSTANIANFNADDIIYQGGTESYRVILVTGNQMVIQSITQSTPQMMNFINQTSPRNGSTCSVLTITAPQVDKFSGDILFIDNKLPFVVTADQMITFRTTIGF